ncbi:MAG TPA: flippase-like domain-containing protein [Candidatus Atribacteria bacterium]|nr:flippase-like domain-containing protein [Candidatus Atribacteria bacterium]
MVCRKGGIDINIRAKKFIRGIISAVLILYLLSKISFAELWYIIQFSRLVYLFLAFFLIVIGVFISSFKWKLLLSIKSARASYLELVRFYFIGLFFNSIMPSTIGGDVIRGYELSRKYGGKSEIFSSIFMERFTGIIALISFAIVGFLLETSKFYSPDIILILLLFIGLTIGIIIVLYDKKNIKFFGYFYLPILDMFEKFELKNKLERLYDSINDYKNYKSIVLKSLFFSFIFQFFSIISTYIIALALNIDIYIIHFFMFVPIITCISMIPISIAGLGVREMSFVYFFTQVDLTASESFMISITGFLLVVMVSLMGGLMYLDYARSKLDTEQKRRD